MDKMDKNGMDFKEINIERMKALFPECVTDGKIDFDKLKVLLGEEVDSSNEKYSFNWIGKNASIKNAITPSAATLIPCKEKSKNWDTTENLYIEGDNLEVLKTLSKTYHGQIKMIYIDPPYNTGKDFVYHDNFHDSTKDYIENTQQSYRANPEASGKYHTNWLNMMYPRLKVAKDLLSEDGIIFISIDDNEVANLRKICDEVFGEMNFSTQFVWTKTATPPSLSHKCRKTVEYVLCYEKELDNTRYFGSLLSGGDVPLINTGNPTKELVFPIGKVKFNFVDDGIINSGYYDKVELLDDIIVVGGVNQNSFRMKAEFKWGQAMLNDEVDNGTYFVCKTDKLSIRFQRPYDENNFKTPNNFLNLELNKEIGIGTNESAVKELEELGLSNSFDFPKPTSLIKYLVNMIAKSDKEAIVLDFFSGSATTAHSVMQLNAEDGGKRKFIMVQLPELCEDGSEAKKAGYNTICDIGQERIRRAGKKIYDELKGKYDNAGLFKDGIANPDDFDLGFKVFKLDSTCIKPWDPTVKYDESNLFELMDVIKEGRSNLDVAYEIMLKYGVFNMPLEEKVVNGKTIYSVGGGYMIISLNDEITSDDVKAIAELKPKAVVFKESGFKDDSAKMNADYTFKRLGIDNVKCI